MKCRGQFITKPLKDCKISGKHWDNKICPNCKSNGVTKRHDKRLKVAQ
jgi:hypothetical protein